MITSAETCSGQLWGSTSISGTWSSPAVRAGISPLITEMELHRPPAIKICGCRERLDTDSINLRFTIYDLRVTIYDLRFEEQLAHWLTPVTIYPPKADPPRVSS